MHLKVYFLLTHLLILTKNAFIPYYLLDLTKLSYNK